MSAKSVIGVIIVAVLIGVVYVVFEKNFTAEKTLSNSKGSSSQELSKETINQTVPEKSSLINFPTPNPSPTALTESTDLLKEAESLEMRDYSGLFEELKDSLSQ